MKKNFKSLKTNKYIQIINYVTIAIIIIAAFSTIIACNKYQKNNIKTPPSIQSNSDIQKDVPSINVSATESKLANNTVTNFKLPILMFHYIRDYTDSKDPIGVDLSVSPRQFEKNLQNINDQKFNSIKMNELSTIDKSKKNIALTFDDGYDDFYINAFPLLKKHNIKATVYIIRGKINTSGYLSDSQIREIKTSGLVEFGSHTIDHIDLSKANYKTAEHEIIDSKEDATDFCYPSGKFNNDAVVLVKSARYQTGVTTKYGIASNKDSIYLLPRIRMKNNTDLLKILQQI